jgi:3-oxoacyl-[acyl-carrier-protein] synthase III
MPYARITATAFNVPEKVLTNEDMKQFYDTSDEWIFDRSGIRQRRWAEEGVGPAALAKPAVEKALAKAGITKEDVELIIFGTLSPEFFMPGSGFFLQEMMEMPGIPVLDIRQQCSAYVYGLSVADAFIRSGQYKTILLIGAEVQSRLIDLSPEGRTVGVLFGDGAGVSVIQATEENVGVRSTHLHADGRGKLDLKCVGQSSLQRPMVKDPKDLFVYMNGREVFKHAVTGMSSAMQEALDKQGWTMDDVKLIIPHQANARIASAVADYAGVSMEKVFVNIAKYGNTTAASIPICIAEADEQGLIKRGDKIILTAFGAGFTWGSAAVIY